MRFYIVIPAHNEEAHLAITLKSLANQTLLPARIVVVNDNSTDRTEDVLREFTDSYEFIRGVSNTSTPDHLPGSKVIEAFYRGFSELDDDYDVICKFDADLEFPPDYLQKLKHLFESSDTVGMAGGFCTVLRKDSWVRESLTNTDHIRGALKAYRKQCFEQIGGLKNAMGWDTIDELLARFHGWELRTDIGMEVRHLKPTGAGYAAVAGRMQGAAFRRMRYGMVLTSVAAFKLAVKKRDPGYFFNCMAGFLMDRSAYLVTTDEGKFIRNFRWKNICKKLF